MRSRRLLSVCVLLAAVFGLTALLVFKRPFVRSPNIRPPRSYAAQIKAIESADPQKDVAAALATGDRRFVGVAGDGLVVPGVEDYYERYDQSNGVRIIPGTSDAIESAEHARLQQVAYEYALRYNRLLINTMSPRSQSSSLLPVGLRSRRQAATSQTQPAP